VETAANPQDESTAQTDLPPSLAAALAGPVFPRRDWQKSIAPHFIALFLWVAFFDQIPQETLAGSKLGWPVLGALIGGILSYLCLYRCPSLWGVRTGRPLDVLATSTFGIKGATWLPGFLLAAVQVAWMAVSVWYATALMLRGLVLIRLLDAQYMQPFSLLGLRVTGALFAVSSLLWALVAAIAGRYLVRVVIALMLIYPIVEALLLGIVAVAAFPGLPSFRPDAAGPLVPGWAPVRIMVQFIFGFFATAGLTAADWGRTARDEHDIRLGGWVSVAMGSWIAATLSLLTVAGSGVAASGGGQAGPVGSGSMRFVAAVEALLPAWAAGIILLCFGLAGLAPAVFGAGVFGLRLSAIWPKVSRARWTWVGMALAWILLIVGAADRVYVVAGFVGGVLSPAAGAIVADYVRSRGNWPGPRRGFNRPGFVAWGVGAVVGLVPLFVRSVAVQPAAVFAFLAAFVIYFLAAWLGLEAPSDTLPG
jgi:cytosine permease